MSSPFTHEQHLDDHAEDDFETCSWCATEVLDSQLKELPDPHNEGARLCPHCHSGALKSLGLTDAPHPDFDE